eukprot:6469826-Amphidinium_carterae.4
MQSPARSIADTSSAAAPTSQEVPWPAWGPGQVRGLADPFGSTRRDPQIRGRDVEPPEEWQSTSVPTVQTQGITHPQWNHSNSSVLQLASNADGQPSGHPSRWDLSTPEWDEKDAEKGAAEAYMKAVMGWLITTRTPPHQRGLLLLQAAKGDLKLLINELTLETLTRGNGGQLVLQHVEAAYSWALLRLLPRRLEDCLFGTSACRQRGESLLQFTARKLQLWRELDQAGCAIPDQAKAYITFKHAQLSERQQESIVQALHGAWTMEEVVKRVRNAERPSMLSTGGAQHYQEGADAECWWQDATEQEGEFLWNPYQSSEEDIVAWTEASSEDHSETLLVPPAYSFGLLEEDDAVAIFATFAAVRSALHSQRVARKGSSPSMERAGTAVRKVDSPIRR